MGLVKDVLRTVKSLTRGHAVTLRQLLRPPVTIRYPEEMPEHPLGARGIPVLKVNAETGELNCTACGLCARSCPPSCIEVIEETDAQGKRRRRPVVFNIDMGKCMVCNLCVEACPFDALEMAAHFELSTSKAEHLVFDKHELAEIWKNSQAVRIAGGEKL